MHIACPHCLATNRVPDTRLQDDPTCGKCGQALLTGAPVELDDARLPTWLQRTELPVLIDFWAPWCGPCRQMAPHFHAAAAQAKGQAVFVKVNSDDNPQAARHFGIRSIPTLILLQNNQEVARHSGAISAGQLDAWWRQQRRA